MKYCEILGKKYEVRYLSEIEICGNMGSVNRALQIITVRNNLAVDQDRETILHETIHAIDGELILGLTEDQVARLAVGLYASGVRVPEIIS